MSAVAEATTPRATPARHTAQCAHCKELISSDGFIGDWVLKVGDRWIHRHCAPDAERRLLGMTQPWVRIADAHDIADVDGLREFFLSRVEMESDGEADCWTCTAGIWIHNHEIAPAELAHAVVAGLEMPVPVEHHCGLDACVRPTHLYLEEKEMAA